MELKDIFLGPLYVGFTYLYIYAVKSKLTIKQDVKIFMYAYHAKVLGFLAFASIYQFYYNGGDTYAYFGYAKVISSIFWANPINGIKALFLAHSDYSTSIYEHVSNIYFFHRGIQEWNMVRVTGGVAILCANSYVATSAIFNLASFIALWKLYRTFMVIYPQQHKTLAIATLFAPSAIFWGGGIMKDTIGITSVALIISAVMRMVLLKKILWKEVIIALICAKLLLMVRSYVLLVSLGALAVWLFARFNHSITNALVRFALYPIILALLVVIGSASVFLMAQQTEDFASQEAITRKLQGFHNDHGTMGDASIYTLGEVDYTPIGILSKLPASIVVSLYRPYPWEIKSIVMLMASVESMIYIVLTLLVLLKLNPIKFIRRSIANPEVAFCFVFVLMLGFIVGLSSYNYGALVRFKIPLLPMYGIALAILYGTASEGKNKVIKTKKVG